MRRLTRLVRGTYLTSSLHALVRELPARALFPLALGIFALFSVLGWMTDLFAGGRQGMGLVLLNAALSGLLAVGYAFGTMRRNTWLFAGAMALNGIYFALGKTLLHDVPQIPLARVLERLTFDGLATLLSMATSYACFLWFINGTAARYLRVRAEMDLAHQIHQVLVPTIQTRIGVFDFFGLSSASGEVGGDLVDVVTPAGGPGWFGYVADVSGHGVSSGVVMGMFKSALRMRLLAGGPLAALLTDLNGVLMPLKSGAMYVTLACVRAGTNGTLDYAVAGHLPILHMKANAQEVDEVTTPQIPIGMFESYAFTGSTLACERGDLLALITDGLTEVVDRNDREFGMKAVKQLLRQSSKLPLPEIADRIIVASRAHGAQFDDQTLLLIRMN